MSPGRVKVERPGGGAAFGAARFFFVDFAAFVGLLGDLAERLAGPADFFAWEFAAWLFDLAGVDFAAGEET